MDIRKLLLVTIALMVMAPAARADEDYTHPKWMCNATIIERELSNLVESGPAGRDGVHLLYVKQEVEETSRTKDELGCHITAVFNAGTVKGVFRYLNQDRHELVGFYPD